MNKRLEILPELQEMLSQWMPAEDQYVKYGSSTRAHEPLSDQSPVSDMMMRWGKWLRVTNEEQKRRKEH